MVQHKNVLRSSALILLALFLSLLMWESIGHHQAAQTQCCTSAVLCESSTGSRLLPDNPANSHDDSNCPICIAAQSTIGYLLSPYLMDVQELSLYSVPSKISTTKSNLQDSSSPRAPPAA